MAELDHRMDAQRGDTLIEMLVAIAIITVTLTVFVTSLSTGAIGVGLARDLTRAHNLALSQLESVKAQPYAVPVYCGDETTYATLAVPAPFSVATAACELHPGLEVITVTVTLPGSTLVALSNYRIDR
jgi:prepilin-type N-terminal cleavage/methylation domain-containing protein